MQRAQQVILPSSVCCPYKSLPLQDTLSNLKNL